MVTSRDVINVRLARALVSVISSNSKTHDATWYRKILYKYHITLYFGTPVCKYFRSNSGSYKNKDSRNVWYNCTEVFWIIKDNLKKPKLLGISGALEIAEMSKYSEIILISHFATRQCQSGEKNSTWSVIKILSFSCWTIFHFLIPGILYGVRVKISNSQILEWLTFRIWKLTNVQM